MSAPSNATASSGGRAPRHTLPRGRGDGRRRIVALVTITVGVVALAVTGLLVTTDDPAGPRSNVAAAEDTTVAAPGDLDRTIRALQDRLAGDPDDHAAWARLGAAYVERSRVTGDPVYYTKAEGALDRSLELLPDGNAPAMIGMGALANARHDFADAKTWATRAVAAAPDTATAYGVLADALTQLGEADAATAAVQRMLDLRPSVASFTRASYDLELRGRTDDARAAMERALADATSRDDIAFVRYHLGELEFARGRVTEARAEYEAGLAAAPRDPRLRQGIAKVTAASGDVPAALDAYQALIQTAPLPQYLLEHANLLTAAGRAEDAAAQFDLLARQQIVAEAAGASDDLAASAVAADRGDAAMALRLAEREWQRRQPVLVADAMAWALHLNGRGDEALVYADRAHALGTVDATFAYHRGMILRGLGRVDEAITQLETALRINPHFSPVHSPRAEQALAELRVGR